MKRKRRGSAVIEFALASIVMVPLLIGVVAIGLNLGRNVQVSQLARDSGSLYVRGVDFSQSANQDILVRLSYPMGMTRTGGTGVVILSKFTFIPASSCVGINPCNSDKQVLVQRITIGNSALRASNFSTAGAPTFDAQGFVRNYMTDANAAVSGFSSLLTLQSSEYAFVAEAYFPSNDISSFTGGTGVYSVAVF